MLITVSKWTHSKYNVSLILQKCLPDCDETHYSATVSSAPFRGCDFQNFGLSALCNFDDGSGGDKDMPSVHPPMWGSSVIEQYREVKIVFILCHKYLPSCAAGVTITS